MTAHGTHTLAIALSVVLFLTLPLAGTARAVPCRSCETWGGLKTCYSGSPNPCCHCTKTGIEDQLPAGSRLAGLSGAPGEVRDLPEVLLRQWTLQLAAVPGSYLSPPSGGPVAVHLRG